jgi:hypothetical protein
MSCKDGRQVKLAMNLVTSLAVTGVRSSVATANVGYTSFLLCHLYNTLFYEHMLRR